MPPSTDLTHFSTARSLEPYRRAFRLLTTQVEGVPSMQSWRSAVVYLVNIHLMTRPHRPELCARLPGMVIALVRALQCPAKEMVAVRCGCASACWFKRPVLSTFRWVFPWQHTLKPE